MTDDEESSSSESSESEETSEEEESSDSEPKKGYRLSAKHVTKVRRMRIKRPIRRTNKSKRYEVEVIIKDKVVKAFADTGADICVMSKRREKALGLKLMKTIWI